MNRHPRLLAAAFAALALSGLGHFLLLSHHDSPWGVAACYGVGGLLLAWIVWAGSGPGGRRRLLARAARGLLHALRDVVSRRPVRVVVIVVLVGNGLAAWVAASLTPPGGLLIAFGLWVLSAAGLFAALPAPGAGGPATGRIEMPHSVRVTLRRAAPLLLPACLAAAIGGQVCFAQDYGAGRVEQLGPHFWPGVALYGLSALCLLVLTYTLEPEEHPAPAGSACQPRTYWLARSWRLALLGSALAIGLLLPWDLSRRVQGASYALPFLLWVAMMGCYLCGFLGCPPRWERIRDLWRAHWREALVLAGVGVLAFLLRAYAVGRIPYSLGGDEATQGLGALAFLEGTQTDMFAISDWFFYPSFGYFSISWSLLLFGRTVAGLRMLAALVGTASVLLTYLLVRRMAGRTVASVAALFLAAQHYHLHMSRLGSINIFDTLFAPLLTLLLLTGLRRRQPGWFAAAGLTLGVAQYYYNGAKMLPFLTAVLVVYLAVTRRNLLRANLANLAVLGLGAVLAFIPLAVYEAGHPGSFTGRVAQVGIFQSGWLVEEAVRTGLSPLRILGEAFLRAFFAFNYFTDRSFWYRPSIPFLDFAGAVLFALGLILALRDASRDAGRFLVVAWFCLAVILGGVLTTLPPASERLVVTTPALAILVALALVQLVGYARLLWGRLTPLWSVVPLVVALALVAVNVLYYFVDYTPRHVYGNPTAEVMRTLTKDLSGREGDFKVYFFGAPFIIYESALPRFLIPEVDGMDVAEDWQGDLGFVDEGREAVFVVLPERADHLAPVQERWPCGALTEMHSSADGRLLYQLYHVDPADC